MNKLKLSISLGLVVLLLTVSTSAYAKSDNAGEHSTGGHGNSENHATFGSFQKLQGSTVTIESENEPVETEVDKKTKIIGKDKKTLRLNQLKVDDKVAIIGSESGDTKKQFKALKIFVKSASSSADMKRHAVEGVVTAVTGSTITLVHQIHTDRVTTVTVNASTVIKLKGTDNATLTSIQPGQRIVVIGDLDANGGLVAKRIHVIPGLAKGFMDKFKSEGSSESATITPSISITPAESVTPTASATGTVTPSIEPTGTVTPTP